MSVPQVAERRAAYELQTAAEPAFRASFDLLVTAPQGVPKLRELILLLAVQGKLLPQNPKDEPASESLARIGVAKDRLVADGEIKQHKAAGAIAKSDRAFDVPPSWEWARLADLTTILNGRAYAKDELLSEGVPVLRVGNLFTSNHWYYSNLTLEPGKYCDVGDLLFAWSASFGPFIWPGPKAIYHYHIWKLDLHSASDLNKNYLYTFLLKKTQEIKAAGHGVSMLHMTKEKMEKIVVPIPPLAEQSRIVARVEELMQLCDALEAHGRLQDEQHARLVATLFDALAASESADALAENWQRIATHFDLLLDRPEAVDTLEQTLLQLAVRGLLVPQDPADETASQLLARMQKNRVHKRKFAAYSDEAIDSHECRLPDSWSWTSIDQISADDERAITDGPFGASLKTEHYVDHPGYRIIRLQNIGHNNFRDEHRAYIEHARFNSLLKHQICAGDLVVAGLIDTSIRCCVVPETVGPALVKADCYRLSVHSLVSSTYIAHYLNSSTAREFASAHHHGLTLKRIGLGNFRTIPVPLPPLAEQHRIVARVEQLRTLCSNLRARLQQSRATQSQLAEALVSAAAQSRAC